MKAKRKRVAKHVYPGLGFPVELRNIDLIEFRGTWAPGIEFNALMTNAFKALATKPAPLTGNELRFVRQHMRLTLQAFARRVRVTHQAIMKWERAGDEAISMTWANEFFIRLSIIDACDLDPARAWEMSRAIAAMPLEDERLVMVFNPEDPAFAEVGFARASGRARRRAARA